MEDLRKKKEKQLKVCLKKEVEMSISNGFEKYEFVHHALPEIDFSEIDASITFLGKKLSAPILISPMVGGIESAVSINRNLARAAQAIGVAIGVGSMGIALETKNEKLKMKNDNLKSKRKEREEIVKSFQVRDVAPDILLLANLGAVSLNYGFGVEEAKKAVEMIRADGLILHLNPLQEALQKNGQTNFKNLLDKLQHVLEFVNFPVIVKEVGCGISYQTAKKLYDVGVEIVDTAGAGGTSWAEIEARCASGSRFEVPARSLRQLADPALAGRRGSRLIFRNWGIQTAESLVQCKKVKGLKVIASGGIRNGIEIAKAIALGAELAGIGLPLLKAADRGEEKVEKVLKKLIFELKLTMFCVGAKNIKELKKAKLVK